MTDEQIRVAMAELEGWRLAEEPNTPVWWKDGVWASSVDDLPDFLFDLNAVHSVFVKVCAEYKVQIIFTRGIWRVDSDWLGISVIDHQLTHALCEFCLRATNKWRDNE